MLCRFLRLCLCPFSVSAIVSRKTIYLHPSCQYNFGRATVRSRTVCIFNAIEFVAICFSTLKSWNLIISFFFPIEICNHYIILVKFISNSNVKVLKKKLYFIKYDEFLKLSARLQFKGFKFIVIRKNYTDTERKGIEINWLYYKRSFSFDTSTLYIIRRIIGLSWYFRDFWSKIIRRWLIGLISVWQKHFLTAKNVSCSLILFWCIFYYVTATTKEMKYITQI